MDKIRSSALLGMSARVINDALSFIVFSALDLVDFMLCFVYKIVDFAVEAEWGPCYCFSAKKAITRSGKILVSEQGESKIVTVTTSTSTKLHLEEISDTLYSRPYLVSEVSKLTVNQFKRLVGSDYRHTGTGTSTTHHSFKLLHSCNCDSIKVMTGSTPVLRSTCATSFTVNSTIVEMLQGKMRRPELRPIPRWSDCDCKLCTSWISNNNSAKATLFVSAQGPKSDESEASENVVFIHGFISSSSFWTETLFPNFSRAAKSRYRLFAIDLLGFGRSPKPADSFYTLREHLDMIELSLLQRYNLHSFHIVAHSLGCILALALAVKHPHSVKSLTLLAPPFYPVPKGKQATQYVMQKVAPRRVWPPMAFGASMACWYEHISRTICLLICKNHRLWEYLITKLLARNRRWTWTFLLEGFFCHTHNAAWHTLHNVIYGAAGKMEGYLETVRERMKCNVTIFHGKDDEVIPVQCSYDIKRRIPRAHLNLIDNKDHITIVVGRQQSFARELEQIWSNSSA